MELYPLKFHPILIQKIWGGDGLVSLLKKESSRNNIGESWEISDIDNHESVISNGFYAGKTLRQLIELKKEHLLGNAIYRQSGNRFPLLIKFIDATDDLSIQVHPNDRIARLKHKSPGKTEMWHILKAEKEACLISGFKKKTSPQQFVEAINNCKTTDMLQSHTVKEGDTFFIPAGQVHAIGKGIILAEIQQSSDVTYRLFDYNRKDSSGNKRDLHIKDGIEATDFNSQSGNRIPCPSTTNKQTVLVTCSYFTTEYLHLLGSKTLDYTFIDSFIILINLKNTATIKFKNSSMEINVGETILIPAELKEFELYSTDTNMLIVYIAIPNN